MDLRLERLTQEREADFLALMGRDEHGGQCWCVASCAVRDDRVEYRLEL